MDGIDMLRITTPDSAEQDGHDGKTHATAPTNSHPMVLGWEISAPGM